MRKTLISLAAMLLATSAIAAVTWTVTPPSVLLVETGASYATETACENAAKTLATGMYHCQAGNVTVVSGKSSTQPPPPGVHWFYYAGQWSFEADYSFGSFTVNRTDTKGLPISGSTDIAFTVAAAFAGFQPVFAVNQSFPTDGLTRLVFSIKPTVANALWDVYFTGKGDVNLNCGVHLTSYAKPVVGLWTDVSIPLKDLCVLGKPVYKFAVQDKSGSLGTFYIDNVGLAP